MTTVEQTVVDLAVRLGLGDMPRETMTAVAALALRADPELPEELVAGRHHAARACGWLLAKVR